MSQIIILEETLREEIGKLKMLLSRTVEEPRYPDYLDRKEKLEKLLATNPKTVVRYVNRKTGEVLYLADRYGNLYLQPEIATAGVFGNIDSAKFTNAVWWQMRTNGFKRMYRYEYVSARLL